MAQALGTLPYFIQRPEDQARLRLTSADAPLPVVGASYGYVCTATVQGEGQVYATLQLRRLPDPPGEEVAHAPDPH